MPGESWQMLPQCFEGAAGLAANTKGEVFLSDAPANTVYRLDRDGHPSIFVKPAAAIVGEAFGPDDTLYGLVPSQRKIIALNPQGKSTAVAEGIAGRAIIVTQDGALYVSEPGTHSDTPSHIWQIKGGKKRLVDEGLLSASGVAFSPDGGLLYAAEKSTKWIYTFVVRPGGSFTDKQPYFWLHMTDIPNDSGAEDLAVDTHGNLYVATRMGLQVCDQNGRVRAILPLPTPSGAVRSLCFGGEHSDVLYVTDGTHIFKRRLKLRGFAPWQPPVPVPSQGAG